MVFEQVVHGECLRITKAPNGVNSNVRSGIVTNKQSLVINWPFDGYVFAPSVFRRYIKIAGEGASAFLTVLKSLQNIDIELIIIRVYFTRI